MKRSIPFIISTLVYAFSINAQTTTDSTRFAADTIQKKDTVIAHTFYFEAGGNALYTSLNYEKMICTNGKYKLAGRIGIGTDPIFTNSFKDIYIPIELNYYRGKIHHWEVGFGFIPCTAYLKPFDKAFDRRTQLMTSLRLGYRYISKDQRFTLRIGGLLLWRSVFEEPNQNMFFFYEKRNYYSTATIWDGIGNNIMPWLGASIGFNLFKIK